MQTSLLLIISNLSMLPALIYSIQMGWNMTTLLTFFSLVSSILYHSSNQKKYRTFDRCCAGILLVHFLFMFFFYCGLGWGLVSIFTFTVALGFFLNPATTCSQQIEYDDHGFCVSHSLWHIYVGITILAILIGSK